MPDELDCLRCGACCRPGREGTLLVPAADLVRWRRAGRDDLVASLVEGHFGEQAFATRDGACVHLGSASQANACSIYKDRGTTCREFEKGNWQCLEFRRDHGLDVPTTSAEAAPKRTR